MPSWGIIRNLVQKTSREVTFEWEITDFFSLSETVKVNDVCRSPAFRFAGSSWKMRMYPKGTTEYSTEGWVDTGLVRKHRGATTVYCTFGIKGTDGEEMIKCRTEEFGEYQYTGNFLKLWSRTELRDRASTLVPNDVLTITCDIRMDAPIAVQGGERALADDFAKLLDSGEGSDVTVEVDGAKIPVHSAVLFARCPALSASLKHESREKSSRRIVVEDCGAEVFRDFLRHLYSGCPGQITNVFQLYRVADRYLVEDLKRLCVEKIQATLSVDTFCDTMEFALGYEENGLLQRAIDFATGNIDSIVCRDDWLKFVAEHPTEANEIFRKSLSTVRQSKRVKFS